MKTIGIACLAFTLLSGTVCGRHSHRDDKHSHRDDKHSHKHYKGGKKGVGSLYNEEAALKWLIDECKDGSPSRSVKRCLTWSTGLEHETLLVHGSDDQVSEYVVNAGTVALQMARYGRAFKLDRHTHSVGVFLQNTGVEFSGRDCAGINEINFNAMTESVSMTPVRLSFDTAYCHIESLDAKILEVISASPNEMAISRSFGGIRYPRSGMSSNIGLYTRTGGKPYSCSGCGECNLKDYTGSYHISISLPMDREGWVAYDESILIDSTPDNISENTCSESFQRESVGNKTTRDVWVKAHSNLANMVQWIEPLLVAVFGASDTDAVCDDGMYPEGSYRIMNSGWGVPGTTDVRTFGEVGTGRYSNKGFGWMLDVATESSVGVFGCVQQGMGSDIRTKSSSSEHDMSDGDNPAPMEVGKGIEIRIFDNFPLDNMKTVYRVVSLVAEASRKHVGEKYVYGNKGWVFSAQQAILEGWNAVLGDDYVSSLESILDIDLGALDGNTQAFSVFNEVYHQLADKHADGFWTGLLLDELDFTPSGNPNRNSWELGAKLQGIGPDFIRDMFGLDGEFPATVELSSFVGETCVDDVQDIVYLAESLGMVDTIEFNKNGTVKAVSFLPEHGGEDDSVLTCES